MAVQVKDEDELQAPPLTAEELAWAKKLDAVLGKMPSRLKLIEVDDVLYVVDKSAAETALDASRNGAFGALRDAGVVLADIGNGTLKIAGMSN